jgi:hypothetical protein
MADYLQTSAKVGSWQPEMDSYCTVSGIKPITIGKYDTGDDLVVNESYLIDESY